MSGYTHKILLFSGENYSGDALVLIALEGDHDLYFRVSLFNEYQLKHKHGMHVTFPKSIIVVKGTWNVLCVESGFFDLPQGTKKPRLVDEPDVQFSWAECFTPVF